MLRMEGEISKRTISASGGSGPVRTLGPKGGGFGSGPTSIGGSKECQRGRWTPKGGEL